MIDNETPASEPTPATTGDAPRAWRILRVVLVVLVGVPLLALVAWAVRGWVLAKLVKVIAMALFLSAAGLAYRGRR